MLSFLEAEGYEQTVTSCEADTVAADTSVVCMFDFHAIRSDEIGRGPFSGSDFTFTIRDGRIVRASRTGRSRSSRHRCGNHSRSGCPRSIRRTSR